MSLETDIVDMCEYLVDQFELNGNHIMTEKEDPCFNAVSFGEPRVITVWPHLMVEPIEKTRTIKATQLFEIVFEIHCIIYHGEINNPSTRQAGALHRAEALERFIHTNYRWNYVDSTDSDKDKVIFGQVVQVDHPVVLAPEGQMWSASRLVLTAESQETFANAGT